MDLLAGVVVADEVQLRVASLGIAAALLGVAVAAARPRVRTVPEAGRFMPMHVVLEVFEPARKRTYEGRPPFEVGRAEEADLVLRDPEVSRRHARFESRNGIVYVDDLESRNGTFLNGRRIAEAIEVREGDAVDAGTTRMMVRAVQPLRGSQGKPWT